MKIVHRYRMTLASKWYDKPSQYEREHEMHLKIARPGKIRSVRRHLARRGIPYFQQMIYRRFHRWIRKREIRGKFEREELADRSESVITIEMRGMQYRGREWKPSRFPTRVLTYAKKTHKCKHS
ncbi:MAG: hypothetical protein WCC94_04995 [Candidatus Bathyarchaeia archaeon]